eukprot:CAMPEP_0198659224 /NCGR_PEP_ID=MMETSP1467-20131203/30601_1 /TAXON_ID=1462469 /ORGANISM="unid. sp., Strain CCMP2135" /LENGTH=391 /DNA_ID=CAMNT_0044395553 /DNA_START=3 /DNA_END=1178 /DNA_ORIENTATION=+
MEEGRKLYAEQKYGEAVVAFGKGLEDESLSVDELALLHSNRSACYQQLRKFKEAETEAESCTSLKPTWSKGWGRLAAAKQSQSKFLEAAAAFEKAAEVETESAAAKKRYSEDAKRAKQSSERASQYFQTAFTSSTASSAWKDNKWLSEFQFIARLGVLVTFCGYLISFDVDTVTARYRACSRFLLASQLLYVLRFHGKPEFSAAYARRVMGDVQAQRFFGAFVVLSGTSFVPLFVFSYVEAANLAVDVVAKLGSGRLQLRALGLFEKLKLVDPNSKRVDPSVLTNASMLEVATGFISLLEMLTPRRNLVFTMLFWQYLQLKLMLEAAEASNNSTVGPLHATFAQLDTKITAVLEPSPALVKNLYAKLKAILSRQVAVPEPGQKPKARCSVM